MKFILLIALSICFSASNAQIQLEETPSNDLSFTMWKIHTELKNTISENWFITEKDSSFLLTFCQTCQSEYQAALESASNKEAVFLNRDSFLQKYGPDSVALFCSACGVPYGEPTEKDLKDWFTPDDILTIEIKLSTKWSKKRIEQLEYRNDSLKTETEKNKMFRIGSLLDFRAVVPQRSPIINSMTENWLFYFQREPYESSKFDFSLFLIPNEDRPLEKPYLIERNDPYYYKKNMLCLEKEKKSTMILVAYILGLKNYKYMG